MQSAIRQFDIFNGDADGIRALHQLWLEHPAQATLITGRKREIALLERVQAQAGETVTVLNISLERNRAALDVLLHNGVIVEYSSARSGISTPGSGVRRAHSGQDCPAF